MSDYEMLLLAGSSMIVFSVLLLFTAGTSDQPLQKSMAFFLLGGVLLYFADRTSASGLDPSDIPEVFVSFVLSFF